MFDKTEGSKITSQFKNTVFIVRGIEETRKVQDLMHYLGFKPEYYGRHLRKGESCMRMYIGQYLFAKQNSIVLSIDENCYIRSHKSFILSNSGYTYKEISELEKAVEQYRKWKAAKKKDQRLRKRGWIRNNAEVKPFNGNVHVMFENGEIHSKYEAEYYWWDKTPMIGYRIAYYKPFPQEIKEEKITLDDIVSKFAEENGKGILIAPNDGKFVEDIYGNMTFKYPKTEYSEKMKEQGNQVGDVNSDARGSGARYNAGKPDFSLIPLATMEGEARVWAYGAKKYKSWNWMKGANWSVPLASLLRHLAAWQSGEDIDEESGESHLDHILCNARMLKYYSQYFKDGDDRPKEFFDESLKE